MGFGAAGASARSIRWPSMSTPRTHSAPLNSDGRLMITTDGAGASHALIAHLDKLAARRGHQLAYSGGWALTGRQKAALRLVPEQAWQAAIDSRGKIRERRADDACGISQYAHRPCRLRGARSNLRP